MTIPTQEDHKHAQETLDYIRDTMESASTFTAISGWGLVVVGAVGLAAAGLSWNQGSMWDLSIWVPAAVVAVLVSAALTAGKAKREQVPLWSGSFRKMAWVMVPTLAAGAILTWAMGMADAHALLPGTWLLLYGAGVTAGGTYSLRTFRWMGLIFLGLGAAAFIWPQWGLALLAVGFGGLHVGAGLHVVRSHGG